MLLIETWRFDILFACGDDKSWPLSNHLQKGYLRYIVYKNTILKHVTMLQARFYVQSSIKFL